MNAGPSAGVREVGAGKLLVVVFAKHVPVLVIGLVLASVLAACSQMQVQARQRHFRHLWEPILASTSRRETSMSSMLEPVARPHAPTPTEKLLARPKRPTVTIHRRRLIGAGSSLTLVLALALGGSPDPGRKCRTTTVESPAGQGLRLRPHRKRLRAQRQRVAALTGNPESGQGGGARRGRFLPRSAEQPGDVERFERLDQRARLTVELGDCARDAGARRVRFHRAGNRCSAAYRGAVRRRAGSRVVQPRSPARRPRRRPPRRT